MDELLPTLKIPPSPRELHPTNKELKITIFDKGNKLNTPPELSDKIIFEKLDESTLREEFKPRAAILNFPVEAGREGSGGL
jgi:hypothetical protein